MREKDADTDARDRCFEIIVNAVAGTKFNYFDYRNEQVLKAAQAAYAARDVAAIDTAFRVCKMEV